MKSKEIAKRICGTQPSWSELRVHPEHRQLAKDYLALEGEKERLEKELKSMEHDRDSWFCTVGEFSGQVTKLQEQKERLEKELKVAQGVAADLEIDRELTPEIITRKYTTKPLIERLRMTEKSGAISNALCGEAADSIERWAAHVDKSAEYIEELRRANTKLLKQVENWRKVIKQATQFIQNGVEFGYITMPDKDTPDSAHNTLSMLEQALNQAADKAWNTRTHVSVPVDPTEEMIDAGEEQHWTGRFPLRERIANIYKAMIAALVDFH